MKKTNVHCILYITFKSVTHDYLKMTEPKNLIVEDKKIDEKMTERGEPNVADVEDKRAADIKTVKGPMKSIILQMMPLIEPAQWLQEAESMFTVFAIRLDEIKKEITTSTEEEMLQLLAEEEED